MRPGATDSSVRRPSAANRCPPYTATLHDESGAQVGDVRSTVRSPRLGAIGLAMIRREVEPGAALIARSPGEGENAPPIDRRVDVVALPFST